MSGVSLDQVSEKQAGGFFVPMFEVKIQGAGLPEHVIRDIMEITYKDNIDEMDSFEITVNNWDVKQRDFKYIGAKEENGILHKLFEPCAKDKQVVVKMGYVGYLQPMMVVGFFTTLEPNFASSGGPTLNVRGLSILHQLRTKKYDGAWPKNGVKKASDIALDISKLRDPQTKQPRFPLPIVIKDEARNAEEDIKPITQKKEYDIDFLWNLARKQGYVVYIQEKSTEKGKPRHELYFGPSQRADKRAIYELEWGKSLIDFKPTLTTANQFKSVTVNGWDRARQKPISMTIGLDDKKVKKVNPDLHRLISNCNPREEYVVDEPISNEQDAEERARALLLEQTKQMVKASGTTVGLPGLRAGSKVEIKGLGPRLSGIYFVTESTHTINDSGYVTKFKARREEEKPKAEQEKGK